MFLEGFEIKVDILICIEWLSIISLWIWNGFNKKGILKNVVIFFFLKYIEYGVGIEIFIFFCFGKFVIFKKKL